MVKFYIQIANWMTWNFYKYNHCTRFVEQVKFINMPKDGPIAFDVFRVRQ